MKIVLAMLTAVVIAACGASKDDKCEEKEGASLTADDEKECKASTDPEGSESDESKTKEPKKETDDEPKKGTAPLKSPFAAQASFVKSGTGDAIVDIDLKAGGLAVKSSHSGDRHFSVTLLDSAGEWVELLANDTGVVTIYGVAEVESAGTYKLEVNADGDWEVESVVPEALNKLPSSLAGEGTYISDVFILSEDQRIQLDATHSGKRHFSITLINAKTGGFASLGPNETGAYNGQTLVDADDAGPYLLFVDADGPWTVKVSPL